MRTEIEAYTVVANLCKDEHNSFCDSISFNNVNFVESASSCVADTQEFQKIIFSLSKDNVIIDKLVKV